MRASNSCTLVVPTVARPFLIKNVAHQAGVSVVTVDRALNNGANVREHVARRVKQAIDALQRQRRQLGVVGRKFLLDLVMDTPQRFACCFGMSLELPHDPPLPASGRSPAHPTHRCGLYVSESIFIRTVESSTALFSRRSRR